MSTNYYPVERELTIPKLANRRYEDPSSSEVDAVNRGYRYDYRVIGGDKGDLYFCGFNVREPDGDTVINGPTLATSMSVTTQEEIDAIAEEILAEAFYSIGVDCVH